MNMSSRRRACLVVLLVAAVLGIRVIRPIAAQQKPAPPATPRIYIFDNGAITGLDPQLFGFTRQEIREPVFVAVSSLIVHPRGTLLFASGEFRDADLKGGGAPAVDGIMRATKPLM